MVISVACCGYGGWWWFRSDFRSVVAFLGCPLWSSRLSTVSTAPVLQPLRRRFLGFFSSCSGFIRDWVVAFGFVNPIGSGLLRSAVKNSSTIPTPQPTNSNESLLPTLRRHSPPLLHSRAGTTAPIELSLSDSPPCSWLA
ncbi:hypothetical protein P8452_75936 [Trifolium repens]|nr:hypothetical protein P8452_75936 [Trifolium repens]